MSWIDDIGQEAFFKGMAAAIKGESGGPRPGSSTDSSGTKKTAEEVKRAIEDSLDSYKKFVQQIKDTTKTSKMLATAFEGGKVAIPDFTNTLEELNEKLEENKKKIERSGNAEEIRALEVENDVINQKKRAAVRGQIEGTLKASAINLVSGFASAAYGLVIAGLDLTKGIIEGQDAITSAVQAQIAAIKATAQIGATIGDTMSSLSGVAAMIGMVSKRFGWLGLAISAVLAVAGPFIKMASEKSAELAQKGLEILAAQLRQVRKGFYDLNASGVTFANGMTGMVQQATQAGLRVEDFANVIKDSQQHLEGMGGGITLASQRLAGISGEIRKGNIGKQLNGLGIELKDQAKVAAAAAAQLQASGRLRQMTDEEVANYTVKYTKNLKILEAVAGKDAEKAAEQARKEQMYADVRTKILKEGGEGALERFEQAFKQTPESLRKGLLEKISLGRVVDVGTNVAMQANKGVGTYLDNVSETIYRGGENFATVMAGQLEQLGKSAKDVSQANISIGQAGLATGDSILNVAREINAQTTMIGVKVPEGTAAATEKIVNSAQETKDALTNAVFGLDTASNNIATSLQSQMIPAITQYADVSKRSLDTVAASLDAVNAGLGSMIAKLGEQGAAISGPKGDKEKTGEKIGSFVGTAAGTVIGATLGSAVGPIGTAIGGVVGGYLGEMLGSKAGGWIGSFFDDKPGKPTAAARVARATQQQTVIAPAPYSVFGKGGITDRAAIFGESGPEAAVPLPDGRNIPVNLKVDAAQTAQASRMSGRDINVIAAEILKDTGAGKVDGKASKTNFASLIDTTSAITKLLPGVNVLTTAAKFISQGAEKSLKPAAPDTSLLGIANKINNDITAMASKLTGAPVVAERKKSEKTVDDIAMIMEAQLSKQESMIKTLKDILTVNKDLLSVNS